jgi:hypothetical protein
MNATERRAYRESGEWPEGYQGSAEERIDTMMDDLKALSYAAMHNDDIQAAQLCLIAHESVYAAKNELDKWGYCDAQWVDVLKMQPEKASGD